MKPPLFVGIALAAVIVAAGLVAPSLRSSGQKTSERAQEQAELARRQLARVSPMLQRLDALVKPEEFKEADLAPAVEKASETLQKISGESSKSIQTAQEMARRCGLRAPQLKPLGTNVAGAKQALAESRSLLKQNDELLKAAISQAES